MYVLIAQNAMPIVLSVQLNATGTKSFAKNT